MPIFRFTGAVAMGGVMLLAACGGGDSPPEPEEVRPHDARTFPLDASSLAFDALPGTSTRRFHGVLDGAGYRIEVPENWNGRLVMYAHGYRGTAVPLTVSNPPIRAHLIANGYAWAASSYSKNYYDVRAGVEDTNALALAFSRLTGLPEPTRRYIIGHSMGGHITGAAIEEETFRTARHKVRYHGAVPMCGVMGDTELFNYFSAYQTAAQYFAGVPLYPTTGWADINALVRSRLFTTFSQTEITPTADGQKLKGVVMNLTGGSRPIFEQGFANAGLQQVVWGTFGGDGTINGILNASVLDTRDLVLQIDSDPALSDEETLLNQRLLRVTPVPEANRLRRDGLRWIPKVNGQFSVPVVSLHTLGDMYVPFSMQQIYKRRADANGSGQWLVQRAIRAPGHCDFTVAEQVAAFDDMVAWEQTGVRPQGDEVLDAATVADPAYGCRFTVNAGGPYDNPNTLTARGLMPACPTP
ncbi:alpha/beta hydrolase [Caldimonas sp.]|uniref:alpha/beta hydrolase family protein n=1 Tax=Caldimonas sp. TaxID=2838790 RepID=UPI00307EDBC2